MSSNTDTPPAPPSSPRLRAHVIREIAVEASADPRSVVNVAQGKRLRIGATHDRVVAALVKRGITVPATSSTKGS